MKKLLSVFLFCLSGIIVSAQNPTPDPPTGSGTQVDPYQIATLENLYWFLTQHTSTLDKYYVQTADIDASSSVNWTGKYPPLGVFEGSYDGGNHIINGITIETNDNYCAPFQNVLKPGSITNLGLTNVSVTGHSVSYAAGFVAYCQGDVSCCFSTGTVNVYDQPSHAKGGFAAYMENCAVDKCYSTCNVTGGATSTGGFVGHLKLGYGTIHDCYSTGNVDNTLVVSGGAVGGFVGDNEAILGTITRCYSTGQATGQPSDNVGAFCGYNNAKIFYSFCDTITAGSSTLLGKTEPAAVNEVEGKSTADMQMQSTFSGWNFTSVWGIESAYNDGYPYLHCTVEPLYVFSMPIQSWAIYIGLIVIVAFTVYQFRRMII